MGACIGITKVFLGWSIAFLAIAGCGRLVKRFWATKDQSFESWLDDFWIGLAVVLCFLQIWNLVLPVNWTASLLVVLVGIGSILWQRDRVRLERKSAYLLLICLPILLRLAYHSLLPPTHYDSGLYHFNTIRWHMEYPVVPGLANLHGRLGFNLSFFLYVALLNVYPWFNHGHNIATSLMIGVLFLQLALATWRLVRERPEPAMPLLLRVGLLPVLIGKAWFSPISNYIYYTPASPALDLPLLVWGVVLFLRFVDYILAQPPAQPPNYVLFELCLLAAVGVTMKLSMLVFGGSIALIAVAVGAYRSIRQGKTVRDIIAYPGVIALLAMGPWIARGMILSGYPAYPATFGGLNVDWRVPETRAAVMKKAIWKKTDLVPDPQDWTSTWLKKHSTRPMFAWPLGLLVVSLMVLACSLKTAGFSFTHFLAWLPPCASVAFWFATAPNPRFVGATLWLVALWPFAGAMKVVLRLITPEKRFLAYRTLAVLQIALIVPPLTGKSPHYSGEIPKRGFCKIPKVPLNEFRTPSSLVLWVPGNRNQTWDAPLPATPYPWLRPEPRGEGLAHGFRSVPTAAASTTNDLPGTSARKGSELLPQQIGEANQIP